MSQWYSKWFNESYVELYAHRDETDAHKQIDLIEKHLGLNPGDRVLDLCCGEGRHSHLLQQKSLEVVGVDLSETLINRGKLKYPDLNLQVKDMRLFDGMYKAIFSLFTSFAYFDSEEENKSVITKVYKHLEEGGYYWLDFLNANQVKSSLVAKDEYEISESKKVIVGRSIEGPRGSERVIKKIDIIDRHGERESYIESVRLYTKSELETMFATIGFTVLNTFGEYDGSPFDEATSSRCIVLGQK